MNHYLIISLYFLLVALLFLLIEWYSIYNATKTFKYRVIVNGTRGKSSVTAYIAAGLRMSNIKTFAKVTGIVPTIISLDGEEQKIVRRGSARVQEQFKMLRLARKNKAEAIVFECMSLHPEYQRIETKAVRPSLYIITNIGEDHFEEMGKERKDRIASICSAIPEHSCLVTIRDENYEAIKDYALKKHTRVILCREFVKDEKLPNGVFEKNINLTLTSLEAMGLNPYTVKDAIIKYAASFKYPVNKLVIRNTNLFFVNGFAVNDPPTAENFISYWREKLSPDAKVSIIFNTRSDRPGRTGLFCTWLTNLGLIDKIYITGTHVKAAVRMLSKSVPDKIMPVENSIILVQKLTENIGGSDSEHIVFGIGNIAGRGFEIVEIMESKSKEFVL